MNVVLIVYLSVNICSNTASATSSNPVLTLNPETLIMSEAARSASLRSLQLKSSSKKDKIGYSKVHKDDSDEEYLRISSRWNSQWFTVKRATSENNQFVLSDYYYLCRKLVYLVFLIVSLGSMITIIVALIGNIENIMAFAIISGLTWLGAITGMIGTYQWSMINKKYFLDIFPKTFDIHRRFG